MSDLSQATMADNTGPGRADGVSIKGTKDGLVVSLGQGAWTDLVKELRRHLERKATFFDGAGAVLDAGSRELSKGELREIGQLLASNQMAICSVKTSSATTAQAAAALSFPVHVPLTQEENVDASVSGGPEGHDALLVRQTIRSGQTVQYPGHVTILGDVNPGGQVVAGGDIVVWGKVRGTLHAGATGDDAAVVCALVLVPTQLRIGNHIARSPDGQAREPQVPEVARVQDHGIVVERWNATKL